MNITALSKKIIKDDFVLLTREKYEKLVGVLRVRFTKTKNNNVCEDDVLQWSKESRALNSTGNLPDFKDLIRKDYPEIAKKYEI